MKKIFLLTFIISSFHLFSQEKKMLWIAPNTKKCFGEIEKQCMQIKHSKSQKNWELFYDNIEGFTYKKGYLYLIEYKESRIENPPADASSIKYHLIKIVTKKKSSKIVK